MNRDAILARARELPVAQEWYQADDQGDGVVRITEPNVSELVAANIWWIRGQDHDLVIDSGLGVASLRQAMPEMFDNDPLLVLTHTHLDHAGGAHEFDRCSAHRAEAGYVSSPREASLFGADQKAQLGLDMSEADESDAYALPDVLIDALPGPGYSVSEFCVAPAKLAVTLEQGHQFELGDRTLQVLHLPGHTPGSISVLEEGTRTLYSGDVVYDEGPLLDELNDSSIPDYVETMRTLRDLPVSQVRPGHGPTFDRARLHALAGQYLNVRSG